MYIFLILNILMIVVSGIHIYIDRRMVQNQRKYLYYFIVFIFSLLMALRPEKTPDTEAYIAGFKYYYSFSQISEFNLLKKYPAGFELGYIILMLLFKMFSNNYRLFFFILTFIGVLVIVDCLYVLTNKIMKGNFQVQKSELLFAYIACYGLLYSGISVRSGFAMSLGLLATVKAIDKRYLSAVLCLLASFSIHRTMIVYLVIFLIIFFTKNIKTKYHLAIWGISGCLLFFGISNYLYVSIANQFLSILLQNNIGGVYDVSYLQSGFGVTGSMTPTRDLFMWFVYGALIVIGLEEEYYQKLLNVVMVGMFILVVMNRMVAISRIYDMFFMMALPLLVASRSYLGRENNVLIQNRLISDMIILFSSVFMLRISLLQVL